MAPALCWESLGKRMGGCSGVQLITQARPGHGSHRITESVHRLPWKTGRWRLINPADHQMDGPRSRLQESSLKLLSSSVNSIHSLDSKAGHHHQVEAAPLNAASVVVIHAAVRYYISDRQARIPVIHRRVILQADHSSRRLLPCWQLNLEDRREAQNSKTHGRALLELRRHVLEPWYAVDVSDIIARLHLCEREFLVPGAELASRGDGVDEEHVRPNFIRWWQTTGATELCLAIAVGEAKGLAFVFHEVDLPGDAAISVDPLVHLLLLRLHLRAQLGLELRTPSLFCQARFFGKPCFFGNPGLFCQAGFFCEPRFLRNAGLFCQACLFGDPCLFCKSSFFRTLRFLGKPSFLLEPGFLCKPGLLCLPLFLGALGFLGELRFLCGLSFLCRTRFFCTHCFCMLSCSILSLSSLVVWLTRQQDLRGFLLQLQELLNLRGGLQVRLPSRALW
mmetsp:Transcript_68040/g.159536  ORF Transcript_68040/g.159536 Transcript_68040/m.159536 type:complete len:449 (+) Transcript_68040:2590-3936(+)